MENEACIFIYPWYPLCTPNCNIFTNKTVNILENIVYDEIYLLCGYNLPTGM